MERLKKIFNPVITVIQSELFKFFLIAASLIVAIIAVSWGALMTVLTDDLKNVVITKNQEIANLESSNEYLNSENVRLRLINDDLYGILEDKQDCACQD